ncbi:MAG TPA: hypothetical protein DCQ06_07435, partial [Myxococcales bacterium]|nr:hypothetical protein [Myxococcales bacterium]
RVQGSGDSQVSAGQSALVYRSANAQHLRIHHPTLVSQTLSAEGQPAGLWRTPALLRTGVYTLTESGGDSSSNRYLLSLPSATESTPDLLPTPNPNQQAAKAGRIKSSKPISTAVFLMLMGLLIFEMWWLRPRGTTRPVSTSK